MAYKPVAHRVQQSIKGLRADWVEIGGLGRLAIIGIVLALIVTLVLGFSITRSARGHLLDARAEMVANVVAGLPPSPAIEGATAAEYVRFDVAVRTRVLGGETIRVKVWIRDGTIVYSDIAALVDQQFALPESAIEAFEGEMIKAFEGEVRTNVSDLSDPAHASDRADGLEELIEIFVPITFVNNEVAAVIEVEQHAAGLNEALDRIALNVWISIAIGLIAIGLVMAFGIAARTREVNRRRRQAEGLLESSFSAQEVERRRIVSALHDDIGQPMYRLLYGIEGSRAKLEPSDPIAIELDHLAGVVREMDSTLRNELRLLHSELAADAGLATALDELADVTRSETDLEVELSIDVDGEPPSVYRTEFYRAAREAITNVRKHANADRVTLLLHVADEHLILEVVDDGVGTDRLADPGLGLSTTRQRFRALDGDVTVERVASGGTRFRAWLPQAKRISE